MAAMLNGQKIEFCSLFDRFFDFYLNICSSRRGGGSKSLFRDLA
jgi:hypothetical protein